ncbi:hypothetical protein [Pontibacter harenae]|uniref:hypothetical protein n=1 Tax=Pontibacter harenae TaxID=2894083 RepID=UPI001E4F200A|nr:hypothetical protein [Pontibacter harenae]MCC9167019.1 hypothetical protein [Pontibacter harenae]
MKKEDFSNWDEERYKELNAYFRVNINKLLESDPYLKDILAEKGSLQLEDLVDRMSIKDQQLWQEFLELDRIKLHKDMQDHLEGKGTPYSPRNGFGKTSLDDQEEETW